MTVTESSRGCWPTELQELLLKACLLDGDPALEAWRLWVARSGFDSLDPGSYRLLPLLYTKLIRARVQHPMLGKLKGIHRRTWSETRVLTWKLARAVQLLEDRGIPTLMLKGVPLAALFYGDSSLRPMQDIDVLVPEQQALAALHLLEANGWARNGAHSHWLREGDQSSWLARNVLPVDEELQFDVQHAIGLVDSERREIDLHWHVLPLATFPGADNAFWESSIPFTFEGIKTRTLCATDHLLHACVHGLIWSHVPPVRWVVDSAMIMRTEPIKWDRLITLTKRLRVALPVSEALHYLRSALELPVPPDVLKQLARLKVDTTQRRAYKRLRSNPQNPIDWLQRVYPEYVQLTRGRSIFFKMRLVTGWSLVRIRRLARSIRLSRALR